MSLPGRPTNEPANYFAFGNQSAKDTEATTFHFPKHLDGSGFEVDIQFDSIREGGDGQEVGLRYKKFITADGQLIVNSRSGVAARLWAGVLGADTVGTGAAASIARHTAAPAASLPYFTVEQAHGPNLERTTNNVFTSLRLEGEAGMPWKLTAAFINGGTVSFRNVASALTPARETQKPAFYPNGCYMIDGLASYATDLTKWSVEVNRNVDDNIQTTGLQRDDVVPLNFDVNVDATVKLTSRELYRSVIYSGGSSIPVTFPTGSLDLTQIVSIATGFGSCIQRVVCPLIEWVDAKVNKLDPDGKTVYVDLVGMGIKSATSAIFAVTDTTDVAALV